MIYGCLKEVCHKGHAGIKQHGQRRCEHHTGEPGGRVPMYTPCAAPDVLSQIQDDEVNDTLARRRLNLQ